MSLLAICFWIFVFSCLFAIGLDKPKHIMAVFVPNAALVGYNLFSKILMEGRGVETLQGAAVAAIFGAGVLYAWACCARSFHEAEAERLKPWANVGKRAAIMAALVAAFALVFSSCVWWQCLVLGGMASVVLMGFSLLVHMVTTDLHWTKHMNAHDGLGAILAAGLASILLYFAAYLVTYGFATTMTPWPLTAAPFLLSAFACRLAWKSKWSCSAFATCYAICLALMYSGSVWYLNLALVLVGILFDLFMAKGENKDSDDVDPIADDCSDKDVGCYPAVQDATDFEVPDSVEQESLEISEFLRQDDVKVPESVKRLVEKGLSQFTGKVKDMGSPYESGERIDFGKVVENIPPVKTESKEPVGKKALLAAAAVACILFSGCGGMLRSAAKVIELGPIQYQAMAVEYRNGEGKVVGKEIFHCIKRPSETEWFCSNSESTKSFHVGDSTAAFRKQVVKAYVAQN